MADAALARRQSPEDLTSGQAAQLARIERSLTRPGRKLGTGRSWLDDSITESLRTKKRRMEARAMKKRRYPRSGLAFPIAPAPLDYTDQEQ